MKSKNIFPIKYVAQHTGLTQHLIRVWEKRYQVVAPVRTDTNRRLYSETDLKHLQLLKMAVEAGHTISQLAGLTSEELMRLINQNRIGDGQPEASPDASASPTHFCELSMASIVKMDTAGLESALTRAAINYTRPVLIEKVIVPLCRKMGELWRNGDLKIINEHLATPIIRGFLWDLLRSTRVSALAPKIVIATPPGQSHELGALTVALIASESGWKPLYFGTNLPAEEIAAAVKIMGARAVALSITQHVDNFRLSRELTRLCDYLSENVTLFIGGQSAACFANSCASGGIQVVKSLKHFRNALESRFD
jgi:methanogenic corrinoid protein MtbC1